MLGPIEFTAFTTVLYDKLQCLAPPSVFDLWFSFQSLSGSRELFLQTCF